MPGLKSGIKTGVKTDSFWSEIGSAFGEPGGTPPPRIPKITPSPPLGSAYDDHGNAAENKDAHGFFSQLPYSMANISLRPQWGDV